MAMKNSSSLRQVCEVICGELNHELKVISVPDSFGTAARALSLNGSVHHSVMDLFKIKTQLGYRDLIPAWLRQSRKPRNGMSTIRPSAVVRSSSGSCSDPFDYAAEDQLIAILQEARERAQALTTHKIVPIPHPYPHPKELNLQRDHRSHGVYDSSWHVWHRGHHRSSDRCASYTGIDQGYK